jgi:methyl-galactoside transport system permease protein
MSDKSNTVSTTLNSKKIVDFFLQYAIYLVFVVLVLVIAIMEPAFLSMENFRNILSMSATRIIIAIGVGGILITGGTDLSAGRQVGLAAVFSASLLQALDYSRRMYPDLPILPLFVPIIAAMIVGGGLGLLNGVIVAKIKVPPFIATLGMQVIVYGMTSLYFDRPPFGAQPIGGLDPRFSKLGTGYVGLDNIYSIPYIVIIAAVVVFVTWILYNKTTFGKNIYAIGGNAEAARVSGVSVIRNLLIVYILAGVLYALGGTLEAARTGGATNNYGNAYELDAIAACVVGGVSTSGGVGTIPGMVIGVLILSVINYGLTFINLSPYWQSIVKGLIIIFAVALDVRKYLNKR